MNLILYGFKRVGKTTYGKKLAKKIKWPFIDTDDLMIEAYQKQGHPRLEIYEIHEILKERFRDLEEQVVQGLNINHFVIAVGGGTILRPNCQEHLKKIGLLVYLKQEKEQTKRALSTGRIPSFLDQENFDDSFEKMYQQREPIYEQLADKVLDVSHLQEEEVLQALEKFINLS
jgi:shikimate kinase